MHLMPAREHLSKKQIRCFGFLSLYKEPNRKNKEIYTLTNKISLEISKLTNKIILLLCSSGLQSHWTHLCSMPRCALILAYRAVPVRFLSSLYGMCCLVLLSRYFLAKPKSIRNNLEKKNENTLYLYTRNPQLGISYTLGHPHNITAYSYKEAK